MEGEIHLTNDRESRRRGWVGSVVIHALILLLLILPLIKFPIPPPGQKGILVSLGVPEEGDGQSRPETQNKELVEPKPASAPQEAPKQEQQQEKQQKEASRDVVTAETPEPVLVKKPEKDEALRKQQLEAERKRQQELEEQRKRAEEEARKQAEHEASKKQFSNLLSGSGKGNTGTPGNQGDPDGDPNAAALEGISTGSGMVGGGLGNRGVLYEPKISDNSQKTGTVVVSVCVDTKGDVVSAVYTQRGSTTTDSELKDLAIRSAKKFRFTESEITKQCGTITIEFKVR